MRRSFTALVASFTLVVFGPQPASAFVMAFRTPMQRALSADVVVVGKVTAIEKETVDAQPFPEAANKVAHKVAVVKVETPIAGADNLAHLKVGFVPPAKFDPAAPPPPAAFARVQGRGPAVPELKEGQEYVFFLKRHPDGGFFVIPNLSPPIDLTEPPAKKEVEAITAGLALLADAAKNLKADNPEVRYQTAALLLGKYRSYPDFAPQVEPVPIPAEESRLILKGLLAGDWTKTDRDAPTNVFYSLGLTDKDGWAAPKRVPNQRPADYNAALKTAFAAWLDGPGQTYQIKKLMPKATK